MVEFVAGPSALSVERKLARIDREAERRVAAIYPMQDQLFILASMVTALTGYGKQLEAAGKTSAGYLMARDRERAIAFLQCVTEHRHAAEALKTYVRANPSAVRSLDVGQAHWWEKRKIDHVEND
jgi:hypothetical protein